MNLLMTSNASGTSTEINLQKSAVSVPRHAKVWQRNQVPALISLEGLFHVSNEFTHCIYQRFFEWINTQQTKSPSHKSLDGL